MAKTALVVDDSATIRGMVSSTVRQAGFDPLTGSDGQDALGKLVGQPVDLIITDLHMPGMDGLSFIEAVRALEAYRFTPILVMTTESQADVMDRVRAAGATGWLTKPFDRELLLREVAKVVIAR